MQAKHTPGPWYADKECAIWRRPPAELYQNGGGVAGDKPLATVHEGWYGEGATGYPAQANARLIAAAPDLLEALQAVLRSFPTDSDMRAAGWEQTEIDLACRDYEAARAAIDKATQ